MLYKGGYIIYRCMMNNSLLYIRSTVAGLAIIVDLTLRPCSTNAWVTTLTS